MNALALVLAVLTGPNAALAGIIEVDEHQPIVIDASIEVPDGYTPTWDWDVDKPVRIREIDGGKTIHAWAPPGKYEIECEALLINWDERKIEKRTSVFQLHVRGPPGPDPKPPTPTPPDPNVSEVSRVILVMDTDSDSQGETELLLKLRTGKHSDKVLIIDKQQAPDRYKPEFDGEHHYPAFFAEDKNGRIIARGHVSKIDSVLK